MLGTNEPFTSSCFLKAITKVCLCFVLQSNYLVFMAELFWWFEVVKPSFVQPRILDTNGTGQLFRQISSW